VPVWLTRAAWPRQSHGRRDDREKESPWPRSSPARPGAATTTTDLTNHLPNPWAAPPSLPSHRRPTASQEAIQRRLVSAFLDWLLVGIVAAAIGDLFGVEGPSPPTADGDGVQFGPFILVELAYFTYFHATSAGQSIGNKILGIRVLDADTGRSLPYARAFARALMSNLSALAFFVGYFWMLWEPASGPGMTWSPKAWSSGPPSTHPANSVAPPVEQAPLGGVERPRRGCPSRD
jgi:uncharacterized RDD family membrane protein YckC